MTWLLRETMRDRNFKRFLEVFVVGTALGVAAAFLLFVHNIIKGWAGAGLAIAAGIVVILVYMGLAGSLINAALPGDNQNRETDDKLARLDWIFTGTHRALLAVVLPGVVFPVFVMLFMTGLNMALVLLALPFGGLRHGVGQSLSMVNLAVAVIFSLATCRYLWKNAGRSDRP